MNQVDGCAKHLPIVLVVDPDASARLSLWRLLAPSWGVLEARDALGAHYWLAHRNDIDAVLVRRRLPDMSGVDLVSSVTGSRGILMEAGEDARCVAATLTARIHSSAKGVATTPRQAHRRVS